MPSVYRHDDTAGGSRYESGRPVPAPVAKLLHIRYGLGIEFDKITARTAKAVREAISAK